MIDTQVLIVDEASASLRIDKLLSEKMENITRSGAQKLIDDGNVRVNFIVVSKNYKVKAGDRIVVTVPEPKTTVDKTKLKAQGMIVDGLLFINGMQVPGVQVEIKDDAFSIK